MPKILNDLSNRLGIGDESTIKKAEEFLRILNMKSTVKLSDVAKIVVCLDLAATYFGNRFDKESAMKLTNLKKSAYQNSLHTIEKILELDKILSVSKLCVQLSCTVVKDTAENLLLQYKIHDNKFKDFSHPQYVSVAVYTACKLKNLKPLKSQFLASSRLKPAQWKELTEEFAKFASSLGLDKSKRFMTNQLDLCSNSKCEETAIENKANKDVIVEIEDYHVWKERILRQAQEGLLRATNN